MDLRAASLALSFLKGSKTCCRRTVQIRTLPPHRKSKTCSTSKSRNRGQTQFNQKTIVHRHLLRTMVIVPQTIATRIQPIASLTCRIRPRLVRLAQQQVAGKQPRSRNHLVSVTHALPPARVSPLKKSLVSSVKAVPREGKRELVSQVQSRVSTTRLT